MKVTIELLTFFLILLALVISVLVTFVPLSNVSKGWVAAVGASFVFGSTGIPMKNNPSGVDPIIFALCSSVGIFLMSVPVTIYLFMSGSFRFIPEALIASADILLINYLAFKAVQILGYAKAPAIWAR